MSKCAKLVNSVRTKVGNINLAFVCLHFASALLMSSRMQTHTNIHLYTRTHTLTHTPIHTARHKGHTQRSFIIESFRLEHESQRAQHRHTHTRTQHANTHTDTRTCITTY